MAKKDIVVVGASAGGMQAMERLVSGLPRDLPAAVFMVWHLSPGVRTVLPELLTRAGPIPASHPADGDPIEPGRIYVAPNDHHMLIEQGFIRVTKGPKENRFRPAIDPLFRSAAYLYGPRVIGVVLSGALDDGSAGLWTIKLRGGTAIVQDPADALHRSMPLNALEHVDADHKVRAAEIGPLLGRLAREDAPPAPRLAAGEDEKTEAEVRIAEGTEALAEGVLRFGEPSPFTCPECNGVLTQIRENRILRFRCHTGHALSADSLLASITEQMENRLWSVVRACDEAMFLLNRMGEQLARAGNTAAAEQYFTKAREAHSRAQALREAAKRTEPLDAEGLREER